MNFILIKDIERCPYVPSDPEYDEWCRKDRERMDKLQRERHLIYDNAFLYMNSPDPTIANMAKMIRWFWDK